MSDAKHPGQIALERVKTEADLAEMPPRDLLDVVAYLESMFGHEPVFRAKARETRLRCVAQMLQGRGSA